VWGGAWCFGLIWVGHCSNLGLRGIFGGWTGCQVALSCCRDGLKVCEAPRFLLTMRRKTYERVLAT